MKKLLSVVIALSLVFSFTGCDLLESLFDDGLPKHEESHCLCLGKAVGLGEHTCKEELPWKAVSTSEELVAAITVGEPVYLYLKEDISIDEGFEIPAGAEVNICLGGQNLIASAINYGKLNITDCTEQESYDHLWYSCKNYTIMTCGGGETNLYAGVLSSADAAPDGCVMIANSEIDDKATIRMYGGKVLNDHKTNRAGANIRLEKNGIFYMYGGTVQGGNVETKEISERMGGSICLTDAGGAEMYMYGGEITGGKIGVLNAMGKLELTTEGGIGGNIGVEAGRLHIYGGRVSEGYAAGHGGNIASGEGATDFVFENCTIIDGVSTCYGGNIYLNGGAEHGALLKNCTVEAGEGEGGGGNIFFQDGGKNFVVENSRIIDGYAKREPSGGIVCGGGEYLVTFKGNNEFYDNYGCDIQLRNNGGVYAKISIAQITGTEQIFLAGGKHVIQATVDSLPNMMDIFVPADGNVLYQQLVDILDENGNVVGQQNVIMINPDGGTGS